VIRRVFWLGLGAVGGIYALRKASQVAQAATPQGLARGFASIGDVVRDFVDEVQAGMHEREIELRSALGLDEAHETLPADATTQDWKGRP
jgi:hypothetical protein